MARATSVWGPYLDERNLLPNQSGNKKGPGHIGVLREYGCQYVSTHYYDLNDNGAAKLDIQRMSYSGGWPSMTSDFSSASSCGGVSDGLYRLISQRSGKSLEVQNANPENGGNVVQYDFFGGMHQKWYLINQGNGVVSIINAGSLKSLDVWEGSMAPGANIAQWQYWQSPGQQWRVNPAGNYVEIQSELSGLVLDVAGKSLANSANIIQWASNGGQNQRWQLIRLY